MSEQSQPTKPGLIWLFFLTSIGLHVYANYRAVSVVVMETLNEQRAALVIQNYFKTGMLYHRRAAY